MRKIIMTVKQIKRLVEWLVKHGHSYEDAFQCIRYISEGK